MKITVRGNDFYLSPWLNYRDIDNIIKWFQDGIYEDWVIDDTYKVLYPRTEPDKLARLERHKQIVAKYGKFATAIIRDGNKDLIGEIDFIFNTPANTKNTAEISYWLAKPYWGTGITTAVISEMCKIGFTDFKLNKIIAHVSSDNPGSARVLEKNGFKQEGYLREHFYRMGVYEDTIFYGLTRKDWSS